MLDSQIVGSSRPEIVDNLAFLIINKYFKFCLSLCLNYHFYRKWLYCC